MVYGSPPNINFISNFYFVEGYCLTGLGSRKEGIPSVIFYGEPFWIIDRWIIGCRIQNEYTITISMIKSRRVNGEEVIDGHKLLTVLTRQLFVYQILTISSLSLKFRRFI